VTTLKSILEALSAFFGFLRDLLERRERDEAKQAGKDELSAQVNKETADAQERMAGVDSKPSDDAVADKLQTGRF
jgi:hypothetical protein